MLKQRFEIEIEIEIIRCKLTLFKAYLTTPPHHWSSVYGPSSQHLFKYQDCQGGKVEGSIKDNEDKNTDNQLVKDLRSLK